MGEISSLSMSLELATVDADRAISVRSLSPLLLSVPFSLNDLDNVGLLPPSPTLPASPSPPALRREDLCCEDRRLRSFGGVVPRTMHSGQLWRITFHSPVRALRRWSLIAGWMVQLPLESIEEEEGAVASLGNMIEFELNCVFVFFAVSMYNQSVHI